MNNLVETLYCVLLGIALMAAIVNPTFSVVLLGVALVLVVVVV